MANLDNKTFKLVAVLGGGLAIAGVCYSLGKHYGRAEAEAKHEKAPEKKKGCAMQFATSKELLSDEGKCALAQLPAYGEAGAYECSRAPEVVNDVSSNTVTVDPESKDNKVSIYSLLITAVTPRPIAFITSFNDKGQLNGAPFSYFSACNGNPPVITIGFTHSASGRCKHTLENIKKTREFVVNIATEDIVQKMNHTCGNFDEGVDELKQAGLTRLPSTKVKVPRCAESPVHMECKLLQVTQIHQDCTLSVPGQERAEDGRVTGSLVVAQVVMFHVRDTVWDAKQRCIDAAKLRVIGRMGGSMYAAPTSVFAIPRPSGNGLGDGENMFVPQAQQLAGVNSVNTSPQ